MINLHVDSITKSYNNSPILSDVFITCNTGEIVGILGRNGCGKSTLFKIIYGVVPAEGRFVKVGDTIVNTVWDCKNLIGFLPQDGYLPKDIKLKTLINFFLPKQKRDIIKTNSFILPFLGEKITNLSFGERRIIELILLIHSPSKFLLLDEPFTGISPIVKEELCNILKSCKRTKGILISDHDYESVLNLADRIILLKNGNTKHISRNEELVKYGYLTQESFDLFKPRP